MSYRITARGRALLAKLDSHPNLTIKEAARRITKLDIFIAYLWMGYKWFTYLTYRRYRKG